MDIMFDWINTKSGDFVGPKFPFYLFISIDFLFAFSLNYCLLNVRYLKCVKFCLHNSILSTWPM